MHNEANQNEQLIDVAVDNGYADQKICYWDATNKKIISKTLPSRAQMGAMCMDAAGEYIGVYDIDGSSWTVGPNVTDPYAIRGYSYAWSELNTVLVNHSLIVAEMSGKRVRLVTGLPFEQYFNTDGVNSEVIARVKAAMKVPVTSRDGKPTAIIEKHVIAPESTAAWLDFALDNNCRQVISDFSRAAIVDIGGNTTDVSYINANNTVNRDKSGTKRLGVLDVKKQLRTEIIKNHKVDDVPESELDRAVREGAIKLFGQIMPVEAELKAAKKIVLAKLDNFISEMVGDASDLDFIVFVGGGAAVLKDVIDEYGKNSRVPNEPEFANARGMLKFLRLHKK